MIAEKILQHDENLIQKIRSGNMWVCFGAGRCFREFIETYCLQKNIAVAEMCV